MNLPPFELFGSAHLYTDIIIISFIFLIVARARRLDVEKARAEGRILGILLPAYYLIEAYLRWSISGTTYKVLLPFELCSSLFFIGAYGHLKKSDRALQLVFYLTFATTLHSLITPTPSAGYPSFEYVRYFICHGLLILNAFYVLFALDIPLGFRSVLWAIVYLQSYEILMMGLNKVMGTNYLYLMEKPPSPTLYDTFGAWPYYLITIEFVAIGSFIFWWVVANGLRKVGLARSGR